MATKEQIVKLIAVLADCFPSFYRSGESAADTEARIRRMADAYYLILADLEIDLLMQAAIFYSRHATFFPSAGALAEAYFHAAELWQGVPSAHDAWAEVLLLFHRGFSRYRAPQAGDLSHPRILRALQAIGGWLMLCNSENLVADRARFLQAYDTYAQRDQEIARMTPEFRELMQRKRLEAGAERPELGPGERGERGDEHGPE